MIQPASIVTVFGSRYPAPGDADYERARRLGRLLAQGGFSVCTGGYSGIMEAVSRGAREANGHTMGVTVQTFRGSANAYVVEEQRTPSLFARLERLITQGNAYVVFSGGMGTIAELCLVWNLVQMKQLASPGAPIFLIGDHWQKLLEDWKSTTDIAAEDYRLLTLVKTPEEIVRRLTGESAA